VAGARPAGHENGDPSVENSLRILQVGYLDAVLVHDPTDMEPVLGPRGAIEVLLGLKAQGVIGAIGIGVHGHRQLRTAVLDGRFDLIQTTYDYSLMRTSALDEIVPLAVAHGLAIVNASPFHGGLLAAGSEARLDEMERIRDWKSPGADLERARALHRWAAAEGIDLRALALQFSLREPRFCVTLVGPRTVAEVEENVRAATAPLPADAWERLDRLWPGLPAASPGGEAR
jgi:D-threo-aldose 1-dehydrogenase